MEKYIEGPIKVNNMLFMLQNKLDTGSKSIHTDAMEARVSVQKDNMNSLGTPSQSTKLGTDM